MTVYFVAWRSSQLVRERETSTRAARNKATPGGRRGEENASRQTLLKREKSLHVIMQMIRIICKEWKKRCQKLTVTTTDDDVLENKPLIIVDPEVNATQTN